MTVPSIVGACTRRAEEAIARCQVVVGYPPYLKKIQDLTDEYVKKLDEIATAKEKEILQV